MLLRRSADVRTLAFVGTYYASLALAFCFAMRFGALASIASIAWLCALSWITAVITHNSLHSPVFRSRAANRVFQVFLSCAYGFPVSEYIPGHNLSHHRFTQTRADVMRTTKVRFRSNLLNFLLFTPRVAGDVLVANYRYASAVRGRAKAWRSQLLLEATFVWGSKIALLAIDWKAMLLFVMLPHLYALWGITSVNYVQHDGCDEASAYNHSRNFVGKAFNWFTFNNGYHTMHHLNPALHWSELADAHTRLVHPHIDPRLEQRSLFAYGVRTFLWPGARVRFDEKPVVIESEGPDADWIPRDDQDSTIAA